jgi:phosphoglycolate phosphatase-like HAD superfamily hydrolase/CMP-N-acetylneuraminic acid synthetase
MTIAAIVPLKLDSRRIPNKNFLDLSGKPLAYHIFNTLCEISIIDDVFCYCSNADILSFLPAQVKFLPRPEYLDGDSIKANELFAYAVNGINHDICVICQAPGPFVKKSSIINGIESVKNGSYGCAVGVSKIKTYSWFQGSPLNYDPKDIMQTQDIEPLYIETSGLYVFRREDYLKQGTRITSPPKFIELTNKESVDIDYPEDYALAEALSHFNDESLDNMDEEKKYFIKLLQSNSMNNGIRENLSHISFDLDGVLIDSLEVMESAWKSTSMKYSLNISFDQYREYIGKPFDSILDHLQVPMAERIEIKNHYFTQTLASSEQCKSYNGVAVMLGKLKSLGYALSIVTSKPRTNTLKVLQDHFPDIKFSSIVTPDDIPIGLGKPHPYPLLKACLEAHSSPKQTLFIGDMSSDRLCAKAAGAHFACASWGYGIPSIQAKEFWFSSPHSLLEYISSIS